MTKLMEIIQQDTLNEQRPKIQYILDQVMSDFRKKGWEVHISYYLLGDHCTVQFEAYLSTAPNEPRVIGSLPLKSFVELEPNEHERVIQCLALKVRTEVLS